MAGILGAVIAGGVRGYTGQKIRDIERQEEFNMQNALLDARAEKELRMKEAGIKLENEQKQAERDKVSGIINSVKLEGDGKGGYETDVMKASNTRKRLEMQSEALVKAGYLDEAKALDSKLAQLDKSDIAAAQLEAKLKQIENQFSLGQDKLKMQGEVNAAKVAAEGARAEAAVTRANRGHAPSESKVSFDLWKQENPGGTYTKYMEWKSKLGKSDDSEEISFTEEDDGFGNKSTKTTTKKKVPANQQKPATAKIGRWDPKLGKVVY